MTTNALPSKVKFSKKFIDTVSFPAGAAVRELLVWDESERGFGLRITSTGAKAYIFQGRVAGKPRRVTIGKADAISLAEARAEAAKLRSEFHAGADPVVEKKRAKVQGVTLSEIRTRYLAEKKTRAGKELKASTKQSIILLTDRYFADWLAAPIARINRNAVQDRFREISTKAPVMANLAFRYLRALWNFAQQVCRTDDDKPILIENPVAVLKGASLWNEEKPRTGRIPNSHIGVVWHTMTTARESGGLTTISETANDLVRFLIATGCRFNEAATLKWCNVDLAGKHWKLHNTKNRSDLTLPLNSAALSILEGRKHIGGDFVFPARSGKGHIRDVGSTTDKIEAVAGVRVTPHDLRRTFVAICHACKIELWKIEALTGHVLTATTLAHYSETENLVENTADDAEKVGQWIIAEAAKAKRQAEIDAAIANGQNVVRLEVA